MPRNSNGIYTLPEPPFVNGTVIESSVVNSDLSDIASALTGSLATTGVSTMTAPLEGFVTLATNPSFKFANALGTGFLYTTNNPLNIASTSTIIGSFAASATASWFYPHYFADRVTFLGGVSISGAIQASVTITGDVIVTGGMIVGFDATAQQSTLKLTDIYNYYDARDEDLIIYSQDQNDFIYYDADNGQYGFEINNSVVYSVADGVTFFGGVLTLPEIVAPGSASASQANIYVKDNSGTTRVAYKDDQGVETFMGGPGSWELVAQSNILTSVASITYNLTKKYSRIVISCMRLTCASGGGMLSANIADDGSTLVSCRSTILVLNNGIFATATLAIMYNENSPTDEVRAEINRADKTGPKQFSSLGSRPNEDRVGFVTGQTASCSAVNTIVIANGAGNIQRGLINIYGLLAI